MSTLGFLEYVQTSAFLNSKPFVPFRCSTFSKTPVERLSRQMILDPTSLSTSQIQLPRNPDPPDTKTLSPRNASRSIDLLIWSMSSLIIASINTDAGPPPALNLAFGFVRVVFV